LTHHLAPWNPFSELARMREDMGRFFADSPFSPMQWQQFQRLPGPSVDIDETEKEIIVSAEIPGVNPAELDVTVDETKVTISGEIRRSTDRSEEGYRMTERRYGRFSRTIPLPAEVKPDEAVANYSHGVLEIRMNKAEGGRVRSRKLKINDIH